VLEEINLDTQTRTASFNYSAFLPDPTACTGTHSIGYSNISRHAYVECADNTGVFEWNTATNTFVHFFSNFTGYVSVAPADDKVLVIGYDDAVQVLAPTSNGRPAAEQYTFLVPGQPYFNPVYWSPSTSASAQAATDYLVFFALTADTNIHNLAAAAAANGYLNSSYGNAPTDCQYANYTANAAGTSDGGLLLANNTNSQALTPQCGACAPGIADGAPADFNASLSGLRCFFYFFLVFRYNISGVLGLTNCACAKRYINLTTVEEAAQRGTDAEAALIPAGAILPVLNTDTGANQCSFGEVSRQAKRGGRWVATVADLPSPALYVVDGASQTVHGSVGVAPHPSSLAWAPLKRSGAVSAASTQQQQSG
jgi:hypothetical protein